MKIKVKDLCLVNSRNVSEQDDYDSYLYLDTSNITDNVINGYQEFNNKDELPSRAKRKVESGDIIISTVRPIQRHYGLLNSPEENLLVSTAFTVLTPNKECVNECYFYYYMTHPKITQHLQMIAESSVSSYPSITSEVIENMEIELPSLRKQNQIVEIINTFQSKINSNMNQIKLLQDYSQLLYHKWFVEFNFPNEDGEPYKDSGGELEDIGGKEIPKSWENTELSSLVRIKSETVNPQEFPNKLFKHYSIPVYDEIKTYSEELGETIKSNKYMVNDNNILVSKLNPWFSRVIYPYNVNNAISSTEFVVLEPLREDILETIYIIVSTKKFVRYCTKAATGTSNSHKRIKPEFITAYTVNYNEEIGRKFNRTIAPLIKKTALLLNENKRLIEFRELLIQKLIK